MSRSRWTRLSRSGREDDALVVWTLTPVEVVSALERRVREGFRVVPAPRTSEVAPLTDKAVDILNESRGLVNPTPSIPGDAAQRRFECAWRAPDYLPDGLWRDMNPTPVPRRFFLVARGDEEELRRGYFL